MRAIGGRRLQNVDSLLVPAVASTVETLDLDDLDKGAVRLAERYAAAIDEAARIAADVAAVEYDPEDVDTARQVAALAKRVEAQTVLAELGPKLLAALEALGATPRARAAAGKGVAKRGPSKLDGLRAART